MRAAWMLVMWGVICLLAGVYGFEQSKEQRRRLETYEPTSAVVLSKEMAYSSSGRFRGVVEYRYEAAGIGRTGDELTALPWTGSAVEMEAMLAEVAVGRPMTAYYDPQRPGESYLLRKARVWPYGAMLIAGVGMVLMVGVMARGGVLDGSPGPDRMGAKGWYRLKERWSAERRAKWFAAAAGVCVAYGGLVGWLYWPVWEAENVERAGALFGGYGAWCLGLLVMGVAWAIRARGRVSAGVSATLPALRVDLPVHVRVELTGGEDKRKIEQVTAALACVERRGLLIWERSYFASAKVGQDVVLVPGQTYVKEISFEVPPLKRHGSTRWSAWGYPRREWSIWVTEEGSEFRGRYRSWALVLE